MEQRVGAAIRAVRRRRGLRQEDVAREAGVSPSTVCRIEHGHLASYNFRTADRVAATLDIRLDIVPRWRGGELDRLLNAGHSAMHELVARRLAAVPGWKLVPEASFSIYGERGVIDVLAWHGARRMLLVIELKTAIVDVQDLLASMDRRRRLAARIGKEHGWATDRATVSAWLVIADTRTNRARLAAHSAVLRAAFPADGRAVRGWLADPQSRLAALSFLQVVHPRNAKSGHGGPERVRRDDDAAKGLQLSTSERRPGRGGRQQNRDGGARELEPGPKQR